LQPHKATNEELCDDDDDDDDVDDNVIYHTNLEYLWIDILTFYFIVFRKQHLRMGKANRQKQRATRTASTDPPQVRR